MARTLTNRYEHVCRNGHVRTEENTYKHTNGQRQCMECPGWQRNRSAARRDRRRSVGRSDRYETEASPEHLAYLRSLIPCLGCGETPQAVPTVIVENGEEVIRDVATTFHRAGCSVATIRQKTIKRKKAAA